MVAQSSYRPHCPSDYSIVSSARTKWSQKTFREIQIAEPRGDLLNQLLKGVGVWLVNSTFSKGLNDKEMYLQLFTIISISLCLVIEVATKINP